MLGAGWVHTEARWRWRWQQVARGLVPAAPDGGVYREPAPVPQYLQQAPRDVRLVSLGSVIATILLMVALLVFFHVFSGNDVTTLAVLLWLPAGMVAVRLLRDGLALLRRES